jgi:Na+/melibiose symporter-like transporter
MGFNSVFRYFMGDITKKIGIKNVYYLNVLILAIGNMIMINFGKEKNGFFISLIINRIGQVYINELTI